MAIMFANRTSGGISVQHDRSPVAVMLSDGSVRNAYTIKLFNKSAAPHAFELKTEGADVNMAIIGSETGQPLIVPADGSDTVRVTLTMALPKNVDVRFVARDVAGKDVLSAIDRFVVQ
jgi:polyferredoxin